MSHRSRPATGRPDHGPRDDHPPGEPLPPSHISETVDGRSALTGLQHAVNDYLLLDDPDALIVILGVLAAQKLKGDTPWLMIIGPSSGAKTELLALLTDVPGIFPLSELTDRTLASGFDPDQGREEGKDSAQKGVHRDTSKAS